MKESAELNGIKEIARRANVSIATVDRVIHNRTGVSEKTREIINSIIKELDYQPNIIARRLASRKVLSLAALIPEVSNETGFWQAPLDGIKQAESEIRQYGVKVEQFFFDQNDRESFVTQAKLILERHFDGVLLAPSFIEESEVFVRKCAEQQIPYVFINSDLPGQDSLCYIGPDLYQSGFLGGHLLSYTVKEGKVLLVNISKEIDTQHHLLRKEEGVRAYFREHPSDIEIIRADIHETDAESVSRNLAALFEKNPEIKGVFVTNSRVSTVANYFEQVKTKGIILIGYDFIEENIEYLKKGCIDFLISQQPHEQGYKGIMALYQSLVLHGSPEKVYFMPIDIITKENYQYYRN